MKAIENHDAGMNIKARREFLTASEILFLQNLQWIFHLSLSLIHLHRYQKPSNLEDDDLDNSYFRRKPTSFLSSNDAKRYTWMAPDDESVRMEGSRPLYNGSGPYVVGSYPPKSSFLSQSSEQITGWVSLHISAPVFEGVMSPSTTRHDTLEIGKRSKLSVTAQRSLDLLLHSFSCTGDIFKNFISEAMRFVNKLFLLLCSFMSLHSVGHEKRVKSGTEKIKNTFMAVRGKTTEGRREKLRLM